MVNMRSPGTASILVHASHCVIGNLRSVKQAYLLLFLSASYLLFAVEVLFFLRFPDSLTDLLVFGCLSAKKVLPRK